MNETANNSASNDGAAEAVENLTHEGKESPSMEQIITTTSAKNQVSIDPSLSKIALFTVTEPHSGALAILKRVAIERFNATPISTPSGFNFSCAVEDTFTDFKADCISIACTGEIGNASELPDITAQAISDALAELRSKDIFCHDLKYRFNRVALIPQTAASASDTVLPHAAANDDAKGHERQESTTVSQQPACLTSIQRQFETPQVAAFLDKRDPAFNFQNLAHQSKRIAADSAISTATRKENLKTKSLLGDSATHLDFLVEKLCGKQSRYTALSMLSNEIAHRGPTTPVLAFASALAISAALYAPAYYTDIGMGKGRSNLMIAIPAVSGAGKNGPIKYPAAFFHELGLSEVAHAKFTSGSALNNALSKSSNLLIAQDEFGTSNTDAKQMQGGGLEKSFLTTATDVFTSSGGIYKTPSYAASSKQSTFAISSPTLTMLMASTPTPLFAALGNDRLAAGFGNRLILLPSVGTELCQHRAAEEKVGPLLLGAIQLDQSVGLDSVGTLQKHINGGASLEFYKASFIRKGEALGSEDLNVLRYDPNIRSIDGVQLHLSPDASRKIVELKRTQYELATVRMNPLYGRLVELTLRVAIIMQRSRTLLSNPTDHEIDAEDIDLASQLILISSNALNIATTEFEEGSKVSEIAETQIDWLSKQTHQKARTSDFRKIRKTDRETRAKAEHLLVKEGLIDFTKNDNGQPTGWVMLTREVSG